MNVQTSTAAPPPRLTRFEIVVHGLADSIGGYVFLQSLGGQEDWPYVLIVPVLAFLVILLSATVLVRRFRPERRGLRGFELGLSGLVAVLGVIGAVVTLAYMASGAGYQGSSPDAGGMADFVGFVLFYPCASFIVLPFALNGSRLSPRLRRRIGWLCCGLALLPFCVLLGSLRR